jgi:hypothetical protein
MPTTEQEKQDMSQALADGNQQKGLIAKRVLTALGQPPDLHRLYVRRLWEDRYRVNIVIGVDAASARIAHSYFVIADGAGNILQAIPEIKKQY